MILLRALGLAFLLIVWVFFGLMLPLAFWPSYSHSPWIYVIYIAANAGIIWEIRRKLRRRRSSEPVARDYE